MERRSPTPTAGLLAGVYSGSLVTVELAAVVCCLFSVVVVRPRSESQQSPHQPEWCGIPWSPDASFGPHGLNPLGFTPQHPCLGSSPSDWTLVPTSHRADFPSTSSPSCMKTLAKGPGDTCLAPSHSAPTLFLWGSLPLPQLVFQPHTPVSPESP